MAKQKTTTETTVEELDTAAHESADASVEISDEDMHELAERLTPAQIDRVIKIRANINKRDEYAKRGIKASTHIVMLETCTVMYKGQRHEALAGKELLIADLAPEHHEQLIKEGRAERPA
jgi:hypothetical protein